MNRQQLLADCHAQDLSLRLHCTSPTPCLPTSLPPPPPPLHLACTFPVRAFPAHSPAPARSPALPFPSPSPSPCTSPCTCLRLALHLPLRLPCTSPYHEGGFNEVELQLGEGGRVSLLLHLCTRAQHNEAERYVARDVSATHALTPIPGQGINRGNSRSMPEEAAAHLLAHTSKEASNLPEKPRNPQRQLCRAGGSAGSSTR